MTGEREEPARARELEGEREDPAREREREEPARARELEGEREDPAREREREEPARARELEREREELARARELEREREELARAQARVVRALVAGGAVPGGFDPGRLRAQAAGLIAKRRSIVARIRPDTALAAGPDLPAEFAAYARARTAPPPSYRADADDFAAWLRERGRLPAERPPRRAGRWWSRLLP
ncbi:hypothetical protein [Nonomuraea sp. NPDC050783]|uniref:hypothetical protein n=1 Tax=Nonomuraea sp. NPDC050783 TaxID=3154634 RepID=UPI003465F0B3